MKLESILLLIVTGTAVATTTFSSSKVESAIFEYRYGDALKGEDFGALRAEALVLMPRGSRIDEAERRLTSIGFVCLRTPHQLPNVNASSLVCDSHGRGYPASPQLNLSVMSRNGLVSDIEVWNTLQSTRSTPAAAASRRPAPEGRT